MPVSGGRVGVGVSWVRADASSDHPRGADGQPPTIMGLKLLCYEVKNVLDNS